MLFLSGASFPLSFMPDWLKLVTQFIPASYLVTGMAGILQRGETIAQNSKSVFALIVTMLVALFIATKLFRWEKEEKLRPSAKLWVLVALLPFFLLGGYQVWSRQELTKARILDRERARGHNWLIQNARIFVGNGKVIESGAVLISNGRIENVYEGTFPDAKSLNADAIDGAGKTILPGLIDVHVHLGASGGFPEDFTKYDPAKASERALESYLYCGVTAVRSAGDRLDDMLKLRQQFGSGEKLGTELFFCGPLFTAEGGHGTEYARFMPEAMRASFNAQFVRTPKTAEEARKQVDDLAAQHVDAIKGVLEAGVPGYSFNRMDVNILRAVVDEAHARKLPVAIHTGNSKDVIDAVALGTDSVEHGSFIDEIPDATIAEMKSKGIAYDPTLSVVEGFSNFAKGDTTLAQALARSTGDAEGFAERHGESRDERSIQGFARRLAALSDVDPNRRQQPAQGLARRRDARDRIGRREFPGHARPDGATRDRALGRGRNSGRGRSASGDYLMRRSCCGRSHASARSKRARKRPCSLWMAIRSRMFGSFVDLGRFPEGRTRCPAATVRAALSVKI